MRVVILKRMIAILITVCLIIAGLYVITELTQLKASYARDLSYNSYYTNAEEYDVLYLGTSHVMYGINPLIVWDETGVTSYNWGTPTCTIPMIYWKLKCLLNVNKPKLVVVDCFRSSWSDKGYNMERMHQAFDAFGLSRVKYDAIKDLMDNREKFSEKDQFNMLFPLAAYHTRWDDLQEIDFENDFIDVKGCEFETNVAVPNEISDTDEQLEITDEMTGVVYLKKIIELCQENDIDILLTYLPYPTDEHWKKESNMINGIATEYGVDYINFTDLNVVNYDTDYSDPSSHMNTAGQIKVSRYLANYISKNFSIEDKRNNNEIKGEWDSIYNSYIDFACNRIKDCDELPIYLMLCYGLPLDYIIDVRDASIFNDKIYADLFTQMGINCCDVNETVDFIIVEDDVCTLIKASSKNGDVITTEKGEVSIYINNETNSYGLYREGTAIYSSKFDDYDVKISVIKDVGIFDTVGLKVNESVELESSNIEFTRN